MPTVQPIKFGVLADWVFQEAEMKKDFLQPLELVFSDAADDGLLDRGVELVYREVEGLPRGTVKAVIDAYGELVDEGCLAVFGPDISENAVPLREEIERTFRVPALSVCGSDDWAGEWTFALPMGSMTDEPIVWAHLMAKAGQMTAGVLVEHSLIGRQYAAGFRRACAHEGIRILAEESIAQVGQDAKDVVQKLHKSEASAIVHCGFGYGLLNVNDELEALDWDPPRYMGTALETCYLEPELWQAALGWIGLEQYDEGNPVGQRFLDRFEAVYGRRPEYCNPIVSRDVAEAFRTAFADAEPLTPRGVKEALERVKMLPAASGTSGTRVSFGNWTRRGWMGAGYLVARTLDPEGRTRGQPWATKLVGRYG
jgi:ABC-type branched-subunit amino acid transport system substrate-binding protein